MSETRKGELYILAGTMFSGTFPVVAFLSFNFISPIFSLAGSTIFAILFFGLFILMRGRVSELLDKSIYKEVLYVALFISIGYYAFYFSGLHFTSAGNASILSLTEVFFSYLFFSVFRGEHTPKEHIWGAVLMLMGAFIVLSPNLTQFNLGDFLILMAAASAPMGNFFQQRLRKKVATETILFLRNLFAVPMLFIFAAVFQQTPSAMDWQNSLVFLLLNGIVFLGLGKICWVEGIHRISVIKANAMAIAKPFITLFFAWLILKDIPTIWQLVAMIPMGLGLFLLVNKKTETKERLEE